MPWLIGVAPVAGTPVEQTVRIPHATIEQGQRSGIRDRKLVVVRTPAEWKALWRAHRSQGTQPVPAIDFQTEMVVAVFAGEKSTGGYRVEIVCVEANQQVRVLYREAQPPPDAIRIQVLTQPYHIMKLQRVDRPVVFVSAGHNGAGC
jgi:hypothetical protein